MRVEWAPSDTLVIKGGGGGVLLRRTGVGQKVQIRSAQGSSTQWLMTCEGVQRRFSAPISNLIVLISFIFRVLNVV